MQQHPPSPHPHPYSLKAGYTIATKWRSQTYVSPQNGVISHGAPIGGIRIIADHTHMETNAN